MTPFAGAEVIIALAAKALKKNRQDALSSDCFTQM